MARLFSTEFESYKVRSGEVNQAPKRLVFVAYEGVVTEPKYFELLANKLRASLTTGVRLFAVNRAKKDGKSHPEHVRQGITEFFSDEISSRFDRSRDQLWIVIDIDQHFKPSPGLPGSVVYADFLSSLITADGTPISAAISNPSFELWLILHLRSAEQLDIPKLLSNTKVSKDKTYAKKYLSDLMSAQTPRLTVHSFQSLTEVAIANAKSGLLAQDNQAVFGMVGTTVTKLIETILR